MIPKQYISMHIHRELLYPLFLPFSACYGEGYLTAVAVAQNIPHGGGHLGAGGVSCRAFQVSAVEEVAVVRLQIIPTWMTTDM